MKKYFIILKEEQKGPFSIEELSKFEINENTPIWYEGLSEWTTAEKLEELQLLFPKQIVPPVYKNNNVVKENTSPPVFENKELTKTLEQKQKNNTNRNLIIGGFLFLSIILLLFAFKDSFTEKDKDKKNTNRNTISSSNSGIDPVTVPVDGNAIHSDNQYFENELTEKNRNYRNNFTDYITISNNSYEYREIGGIFNLKIILTNNTDYAINGAIVSVNYIQENGKLHKSESVSFEDIPAHSSQTQYAPDSDRGTSVDYYIENIVSTEMNFNFPNGNGSTNDPYFYKYN